MKRQKYEKIEVLLNATEDISYNMFKCFETTLGEDHEITVQAQGKWLQSLYILHKLHSFDKRRKVTAFIELVSDIYSLAGDNYCDSVEVFGNGDEITNRLWGKLVQSKCILDQIKEVE